LPEYIKQSPWSYIHTDKSTDREKKAILLLFIWYINYKKMDIGEKHWSVVQTYELTSEDFSVLV